MDNECKHGFSICDEDGMGDGCLTCYQDEVARLRWAISSHRKRWQDVNGTRESTTLPSDLKLWEVLDGT